MLRVPVDAPSALCWIPRKEVLVVGTRENTLVEVDPVMGTRVRNTLDFTPITMCMGENKQRYGVLGSDGGWAVGSLGTAPEHQGSTEFDTPLACMYFGKYFIAVGERSGDRYVHVYDGEQCAARCRIPRGAMVYQRADGKLGAARLTRHGLELTKVRRGGAVPDDAPTEHTLFVSPPHLFGWTAHGAVAWSLTERTSMSFGLLDMNVGCIHATGEWAAIGTVGGVVGLIDMTSPMTRRSPFLTKAHDTPVHSIAFFNRGQWFATAADRVHLWSWDANESP